MARWFDNAARSAARRELATASHPTEGLTRRTVLTRGAVVAGVAWTAPMLMQTAAYAGASMCPSGTTYCSGAGTSYACCTSTQTCNVSTAGAATCNNVGAPGGTCSNQGVGNCTNSRCNGHVESSDQCNACARPHICGGESAPCSATDICAPGLSCAASLGSTGTFCRKKCTNDGDCASGQICDSTNYCAQTCSINSDCTSGERCVADGTTRTQKICNYT